MTQPSTTPRRITLKLYTPHEGQRQIHRSATRFNAVCFGRQSGKTTYGLNKIADRAWRGPRDGIYWYVLQSWDSASVAFHRMLRWYFASPRSFAKKPNESDLSCQFYHGPSIGFKSGKNYQDLRIETLNGVVIDEVRQQQRELWPMIIRPMLAKRNGWADHLSTPNGFEHFYDICEAAKRDPEWSFFQAPSTVAPWWTPAEIESARSAMSEAEFAQEILAEFREIGVGKVYLSHGQHNQLEAHPFAIRGQSISPYLPIIVGLDFNVGKMIWLLGQRKEPHIHFHDEIAMRQTSTQEAAQALVPKLLGHKPGVVLIGDASGKARRTSASATDYQIILEILRAAGIQVRNLTPESNPHVKDRVNMVNMALKAADGTTTLTYNPQTCKELKLDLERVIWKAGAGDAILDKADAERTHASDAAGYPVAYYSHQLRQRPGKLYVIEHGMV